MTVSAPSHPASIDLEAFACGEPNDSVKSHVDACDSCRAFTTELRSAQLAFAGDTSVDDMLSAALKRAEPPKLTVVKSAPDAPDAPIAAATTSRRASAVMRILPFVAMAAGILLWMRLSRTNPSELGSVTPPGTAVVTASPTTNDTTGTAFKGGTQLAVIRERDGVQKRFMGEVSVKKGDRLRIEVALDHPANIIAGVLADDGTFLDLLHEAPRGTGTFYSEEAARFDDSPTRGFVIVGTRDAVEELRAHPLAYAPHALGAQEGARDVTSMRVTWEGP
jgi:hypothetical protein